MEENINTAKADTDLLSAIVDGMGLTRKDVRQIPALTLAYLGDAVYEIVIRSMLVESGIMHVSELNRRATGYVRAAAQKELLLKIEPMLDEDEISAFKRGRNSKSASTAKNASVTDYRIATGFEALIGFLYLEGRFDRILELVKAGISEQNS